METTFSILLSRYIDSLAINKAEFIRMSGIDKSTFYKILNGTRVPTKKQFHSISSLLALSENDNVELDKAYFSVVNGQQAADSVSGVIKCLSALSKKEGAYIYEPLKETEFKEAEGRTYFPFSKFQNYFYQELDRKLSDENAKMDVFMDSSCRQIFNLVIGLLIKHSDRKAQVRHLFQYPNNLRANQTPILDSFAEEASIITENLKFYEVWYYYSLGSASSSEGIFMPYGIVFEDELILFSSDGFIILKDADVVKAAEEHFEKILGKSKRLLKYFDDIYSYTAAYKPLYGNLKDEWLSYHSSFCAMTLITEDMIKKYVPKEYLEFSKNYFEQTKGVKVKTEYLTLSGLEAFAKTGILDEIPSEISGALEKKDRALLLKKILEKLGRKYFIVNSKFLPVTDGWNVYVINDQHVLISRDRSTRYIMIDEINIVNAFSVFMKNIYDTHLVMSLDEAKNVLQGFIDSCEK